jgi:hypothetical protein
MRDPHQLVKPGQVGADLHLQGVRIHTVRRQRIEGSRRIEADPRRERRDRIGVRAQLGTRAPE